MTTRIRHPQGVPCWIDLWTSDPDAARTFYTELFDWTVDAPIAEFGGYFNFRRDGEWIAGGMGDMGDPNGDFFMSANNTWKIYLSVDDIEASVAAAQRAGATIASGGMAVGELGKQAVLQDPTGATLGFWQAGTHPGFTTIDEPGAPTWFEEHTRDHDAAVAFYRDVLGLVTENVGDTDEFRYTTLNGPSDCGQVGGIMDATAWLPDGVPNYWTVYFFTDDVDASAATVTELGGSVIQPAQDTPYGRIATVADTTGSTFRLRTPPSA